MCMNMEAEFWGKRMLFLWLYDHEFGGWFCGKIMGFR